MKEKLFILSFILLTLTFDSCFDEETDYEVDTPSCVSVEKSSKNEYEIISKIWKSKEIEFEIFNDCERNYTIIDYDVSGDIKNIRIEGLSKNKIIKSKNQPFKVIISPVSAGIKTIYFSIKTDIGDMYVSSGISVEY